MGNNKKILVTGGAGFIGSNFVRFILNCYSDYSVVNFDVLTYAGNLDNLKDVFENPNYEFVRGDITCASDVAKVMQQGIDYVIHFAAESHVDRSIAGPEVFTRTNVLGTQVLLEFAKLNNVERFVHVSTDEVYGSLGNVGCFTETTSLAPNSPYSASKAGSDFLVRAYCKTFSFPGIIIRCSNNYGAYQFPEKLIPLMIINAQQGRALPVYGDGMNVRDWLYVEDHCSAIAAVLHRGEVGEVYNIGGNNEWKNIDVVKLILKELGKPESLIEFVEDRPGHDRRYAMDASKIKNELGWQPSIQFQEGIRKTIRWYLENTEWVSRVLSGGYRE